MLSTYQVLNVDMSLKSTTVKPRSPIYRKSRFTAANFFPQIGLSMHIVNKQNPDLPRTPIFIYRECILSPKLAVNRGFTVYNYTYRYVNLTWELQAIMFINNKHMPNRDSAEWQNERRPVT